MTESEALLETTRLAPQYPIEVIAERGYYRAFAVDFPYMVSMSGSSDMARGMAYFSVFETIKSRLLRGGELPPMTVAEESKAERPV